MTPPAPPAGDTDSGSPATGKHEPGNTGPEPATATHKPTTARTEPATAGPEPTTARTEPATAGPEPTTGKHEPATARPESATATHDTDRAGDAGPAVDGKIVGVADGVGVADAKDDGAVAPAPRVDGRTARSERTRSAIVDAHLELIREGDMRPTADRIAKQAGVSLRALWSHFADMEALFTASGGRVLELRAANHRPVRPDLPLTERIAAYCDQQARLLEEITPTAKAAAIKEPFSDALRRYRRLHVARTRDELAALFAAELAGDDERLNALIAVSMWPTWSTWRETMALSPEAARSALARTITALLAG